jgi:hypothetical protein
MAITSATSHATKSGKPEPSDFPAELPNLRPSWKAVYTIVERAGKRHWLRVGVAFVNRDGSLTVRLDAVPITGQLHIREPLRDGRDGGEVFLTGGSGMPGAPGASGAAEPRPLFRE